MNGMEQDELRRRITAAVVCIVAGAWMALLTLTIAVIFISQTTSGHQPTLSSATYAVMFLSAAGIVTFLVLSILFYRGVLWAWLPLIVIVFMLVLYQAVTLVIELSTFKGNDTLVFALTESLGLIICAVIFWLLARAKPVGTKLSVSQKWSALKWPRP
jgi:hypothetical protein